MFKPSYNEARNIKTILSITSNTFLNSFPHWFMWAWNGRIFEVTKCRKVSQKSLNKKQWIGIKNRFCADIVTHRNLYIIKIIVNLSISVLFSESQIDALFFMVDLFPERLFSWWVIINAWKVPRNKAKNTSYSKWNFPVLKTLYHLENKLHAKSSKRQKGLNGNEGERITESFEEKKKEMRLSRWKRRFLMFNRCCLIIQEPKWKILTIKMENFWPEMN